MIELPGGFWAGWITVITLVSLGGLAWFVISLYFGDSDAEEAQEIVWDETLREGAHPAPMWWFWLIFAAMIFSAGYLLLYPGLGSYEGILGWSQVGHIQHRQAEYEESFGDARAAIAGRGMEDLRRDPQVLGGGRRVYDRMCAACHGYDARGQASTFPDLTDGVWQWGGTAAAIEHSIRHGRNAVMVGWADTLGEDGVQEVVEYLQDFGRDLPGKQHYERLCVACHGLEGEGNPALGAPSLRDDVWLYGNDAEALRTTVAEGRNGVMPAFGDRLDEAQIRMLVAWLLAGAETVPAMRR